MVVFREISLAHKKEINVTDNAHLKDGFEFPAFDRSNDFASFQKYKAISGNHQFSNHNRQYPPERIHAQISKYRKTQ